MPEVITYTVFKIDNAIHLAGIDRFRAAVVEAEAIHGRIGCISPAPLIDILRTLDSFDQLIDLEGLVRDADEWLESALEAGDTDERYVINLQGIWRCRRFGEPPDSWKLVLRFC